MSATIRRSKTVKKGIKTVAVFVILGLFIVIGGAFFAGVAQSFGNTTLGQLNAIAAGVFIAPVTYAIAEYLLQWI